MAEVCVLADGRRVKYSLKQRERDPCYLVTFRGPDGKPKERSTQERNKKRAAESAIAVIRSAYEPKATPSDISWEEAIARMVEHMQGHNLRPQTIKSYRASIKILRDVYPNLHGPAGMTPTMAERFKVTRLKSRRPNTVKGDLNELSIVYGRWWVEICKILASNPFADVEPPKVDKPEPIVLTIDEQREFLSWLSDRWGGWRLPSLFLEVKVAVGCRIYELASLPRSALQDGRLVFEALTAKGRKTRRSKPPKILFDELSAVAGPTFVFESFSERLRSIHRGRGRQDHVSSLRGFAPERLVAWLEDEVEKYRSAHPERRRFKLHNFRGTAMSRAKLAGVAYDDAAVAFGCHPETMRRHYIHLDETLISDSVMDRLNGVDEPQR
ncbi:site-specific integrase [Tundrisphaera sp. TA3]|uniref:site-specific integrase n=1 Tax=Tundrisphaera sp. TA3 TaxID=3435775 RepID=UPI003EBD24B0